MRSQSEVDRSSPPGGTSGSNASCTQIATLLVVEDALIHSTIISRIANQTGFATTVARSFDAAAEILARNHFDCVTLDLGLGERAGVEVLRLLSESAFKAPIVIISASEQTVCDGSMAIAKSLDLNVCDPIPKPIDLKVLRETFSHIRLRANLEKLSITTP